tara:strand:+ start:2543 stop:3055 length:513 start_codon:yes stop_codon:yes gene_type:complete
MNEILIVPHPLLRQKSKQLKKVTNEDIELSKNMKKIMKKAPGVGLAANQIGILKQIITVHIQDKEKEIEKIYALFNPRIINTSKELVVMEEGCLSLPKQFANIERPQSITLNYLNESNKVVEERKEGLEARILQHEIDHLYGKLFVDYLSSLKRNILIKKVKKLKKMGEI